MGTSLSPVAVLALCFAIGAGFASASAKAGVPPKLVGEGPAGADNGALHACTGVQAVLPAVICVRAGAPGGGTGTAALPFASINAAIAAAKAGKHILCEKPLALNSEQGKTMLDAVKKAKVVHMICQNYRRIPAIALAKRLIEDGSIGTIYHYRARYAQDWITDPEFPLVWRLKKELSGSGAHGDINAHIIDLARYLVGEFKEVCGMMNTFIKRRPIEVKGAKKEGLGATAARKMGTVTVDDTSLFIGRFENGAIASTSGM